ncbi:MAG: hypothetical protein RL375_1008, partial [Pseudomonadota bacterium]
MRNATRLAYNAYLGQIAKLNGVASAVESFAATPSVQQRLESRIQESSDFLRLINLYPVTEMAGETIGLDVTGPIAGRTDTSGSDRATRDVSALDNRGYTCSKTNYDTHLTYAKLDAWAKFPDFQARIRNAIVRRQALDRIMIGWNGTSIAANSNLTTNPLLQDVNIGWLQKMRAENSARVMTGGATAGTIKVGTGGTHDYASLDALVYDLVNNMIDPWYREDSGLRVILGRDLLAD